MTPELQTELRQIARDTYKKARVGRPHMPDPDTDEGQRKIDRLFDIIAKPFTEAEEATDRAINALSAINP